MKHLLGHERLAQQVGEMVAAKVYDRSSSDYRSALFGEFGKTQIEKLFLYALEAFCEYDYEEDVLFSSSPENSLQMQARSPLLGSALSRNSNNAPTKLAVTSSGPDRCYLWARREARTAAKPSRASASCFLASLLRARSDAKPV